MKKTKVAPQAEATGSDVPTIQEEVQDLDSAKVLNKRTRSGKTAETPQPQHVQPSIPKRKRKHVVRKLKTSSHDMEEEEGVSKLVSREVRKKKVADDVALEKTLQLAKEIELPAEVLLKEFTVEAAQLELSLQRICSKW